MRAYDDGGEQEYTLAEVYKKDANELKYTHSKVSSILNKLSETYEKDGERQDLSNELN
mgnify:FL=1